MSLEATMIVLDNSAHSLNGDFPPSRLQAQSDSVFRIFGAKCRAHPENEVGLMVMGGKGSEVLVTLTTDEGKIGSALHGLKPAGESDLATGIQVAQLALKHRQNKNQRQRIVVFVCSPVKDSQASLVKIGKKLKKNNVALDIVSFGTPDIDLSIPSLPSSSSSAAPAPTPETNDTKLAALVEATSSSDNSHFLSVEPGPALLSERVGSSAILRSADAGGDADMGGMGGGGGGAADEYGVDPNLDPELAMALRMSLEEERARQAASSAAASTSAAAQLEPVPEGVSTQITDPTPATEPKGAELTGAVLPTSSETMRQGPPENTAEVDMMSGGAGGDDDEDEDLKRALALSQGLDEGDDVEMGAAGGLDDTVDDEDDDIARAIALSMQDAEAEEKKPSAEGQ
ncbi:hypothetical protein BMF94_2847 [Rhodotorula taiwanensis]|uniref:VWFA domain-containing protein n=1 Tax=Rhodotorula taiwanensis TaxID=741276 RepID=A0A2S5BB78_9BASI|nr:hypothetical protein BMF94_2847 [Rhodotorula taiwanensis]